MSALIMKVNFAQGLCQGTWLIKSVDCKLDRSKFEEDFMVYKIRGVNVVLRKQLCTFVEYKLDKPLRCI